MHRIPTLTSTVNVMWECPKGIERDVDVLVEFTFDGVDDLDILAAEILGEGEPYGISEDRFDGLVDAAVADCATDAYNDWLSGQDGSED